MSSNGSDEIEHEKNRISHWEAKIAEGKAKIKIMKTHISRLEKIIQGIKTDIDDAEINILIHRENLLILDPKGFSEK